MNQQLYWSEEWGGFLILSQIGLYPGAMVNYGEWPNHFMLTKKEISKFKKKNVYLGELAVNKQVVL